MKPACIVISAIFFLATGARAWDSLGHGLAATTGAKIMHDQKWAKFLSSQDNMLGAAAAFPDIPMRQQSNDIAGFEAEAPNHYFHIDDPQLAPKLKEVRKMSCNEAVDFLAENFSKPPPPNAKMPTETETHLNAARINKVGISPWRAEQFEKMARIHINEAAKSNGEVKTAHLQEAAYYLGLSSHFLADHAVPWHPMTDAHGVQAGHPNIHVFLEGCADKFLNKNDPLFDANFAKIVESEAKLSRIKIDKFLKDPASEATPDFAVETLQESLPEAKAFEALDTNDAFVTGQRPKPGTGKDGKAAARKPEACVRFKDLLAKRLATGAANVSVLFDHAVRGLKVPAAVRALTAEQIAAFAQRPYPWFSCVDPVKMMTKNVGDPVPRAQ